jgi:putative ABC transport system substrate-binding protein
LLKEIAPHVTRVAVIRDPAVAAGAGQLGAIQSVAPSFGVELSPVGVRDTDEIEHGATAIARSSNGGLIVTSTTQATVHRTLIIALAARHKLPTVYSDRVFVTDGRLISYGPDRVDSYRRAAGYVDRILKGEKPADLPVQNPTKYELVVNLKTARALGVWTSRTLLIAPTFNNYQSRNILLQMAQVWLRRADGAKMPKWLAEQKWRPRRPGP